MREFNISKVSIYYWTKKECVLDKLNPRKHGQNGEMVQFRTRFKEVDPGTKETKPMVPKASIQFKGSMLAYENDIARIQGKFQVSKFIKRSGLLVQTRTTVQGSCFLVIGN